MRGAWYVVEIFCALCILRALFYIRDLGDISALLALASLLLTFALTVWTLGGRRWAGKVLAAVIGINAAQTLWSMSVDTSMWALLQAALAVYLLAGAIRLWRLQPQPAPAAPPPANSARKDRAWYVVEASCGAVLLLLPSLFHFSSLGVRWVAYVLWTVSTTYFLAFLTFRGNRAASRSLALGVAFVATVYAWSILGNKSLHNIYGFYGLLGCGYYLIGAVKLWFIKELPTRFTEPPLEPTVHG